MALPSIRGAVAHYLLTASGEGGFEPPKDRKALTGFRDRARLGARRVAGDIRASDGRRHPGAALPDLAGGEVVRPHKADRAATATATCSTTRASGPTTAMSAAASSPATRAEATRRACGTPAAGSTPVNPEDRAWALGREPRGHAAVGGAVATTVRSGEAQVTRGADVRWMRVPGSGALGSRP